MKCFCLKFINIVYILLLLFILLQSGDIEINPGPNYKSNKCRVLYHIIRGLYNNIKDLQIACHKYDIILCSETLVSNRRHISEVSLPGFNNMTLLLRDSRPRIRDLATYIRSGYSVAIKKKNVCTCHEFQVIREFAVSLIISRYLVFTATPIYDCLLSSMSDFQEFDRKSSLSLLAT